MLRSPAIATRHAATIKEVAGVELGVLHMHMEVGRAGCWVGLFTFRAAPTKADVVDAMRPTISHQPQNTS